MNIITLKKAAAEDNFLLKEDNNTVLEIRYKPDMHTARVKANDERRVLIIENESFLKIKVAIKNEYGIRIGSLTWDNFSDTHGTVEIEDIRFRFLINHKPTPHIEIYKGRNLIYSCHFEFNDNNPKEIKYQASSSVIAVSWYLFLKTSSEQPAASIA